MVSKVALHLLRELAAIKKSRKSLANSQSFYWNDSKTGRLWVCLLVSALNINAPRLFFQTSAERIRETAYAPVLMKSASIMLAYIQPQHLKVCSAVGTSFEAFQRSRPSCAGFSLKLVFTEMQSFSTRKIGQVDSLQKCWLESSPKTFQYVVKAVIFVHFHWKFPSLQVFLVVKLTNMKYPTNFSRNFVVEKTANRALPIRIWDRTFNEPPALHRLN